jgi:hypothetical protein
LEDFVDEEYFLMSTYVTDNFARPNGALGSNWATPIPNHAEFQPWTGVAAGNILINNNGFGPDATNGLDCACLWAGGQSFGNDQWASATIKTVAPYTATLNITAASRSGGNTTYTYTVASGSVAAAIAGGALYVVISGMAHAGNNGTFTATTFGSGTFTVANASGVTATESGTGVCPSDSGGGVGVRFSGTSAANLTGYFYHVGTNSFGGDGRVGYHELWKVVNGVGTFLFGVGSADTSLPAAGDSIAITAVGNVISAYINGYLQFQATDSSIASGVPALWAFAVSGNSEYVWTTWNNGGATQFGGNNGTTFNNFQAGDTTFVPATGNQVASETFLRSGTYGNHDLVPYSNGDLHTANANWAYEGASTFTVSSGAIYDSHAGLNFAYRSDISAPTNDQWSEVVCKITAGSATQNGGPAVRVSTSAQTGYVVQCANDLLRLSKCVGGALTTLGSGGGNPTTGSRVRLTVVGTTLNVYLNEALVIGPITDSAIASGNVGIFSAGNVTANGFSAWAGGSMTMLTAATNFAQLSNQASLIDPTNGLFAAQFDSHNLAEVYENTLIWLANQYSQAVTTGASIAGTSGPLVRGGTGSGYLFGCSGNNAYLFRIDSGVPVQLATAAHTYASGETYRLESVGSTLVGKINGSIVLGPITDSTYLSGKPGLMFAGIGDGLVAKNSFDNWAAGDFLSSISGNAGIAGATVTLSGDASASTTADGSGNYSFGSLLNGSYTVTPSLAGYTFSPTSISFSINSASVAGVNFVATASAAGGGSWFLDQNNNFELLKKHRGF